MKRTVVVIVAITVALAVGAAPVHSTESNQRPSPTGLALLATEALATGELTIESLFDIALLSDAEFGAYLTEHGHKESIELTTLYDRAEMLSSLLESDIGQKLVERSDLTSQIGDHYRLSKSDAVARTKTQLRGELVGATLRHLYSDALSEVWLDADGTQIVVDLAVHSQYPASAYTTVPQASKDRLRKAAIELARGASLRFGERPLTKAATDSYIDALQTQLDAASVHAIVDLDIRTWDVQVRTVAEIDEVQQVLGPALEDARLGEIGVSVEPLELGGDDGNIVGGLDTGSCTSGFVAERAGVVGILFAEHCGVQYHEGLFLEWVAAADMPWGEVELRRLATHTWTAQFYSNWTQLNDVNSVKSYASTNVGATYCMFGRTNGRRCGVLLSKDYLPGNYPGPYPVTPAQKKYLRFDANLSTGGDSGGPYSAGTSALGLVSGSSTGTAWASSAYYADINFADIKTK